jgi:hypothetical protein
MMIFMWNYPNRCGSTIWWCDRDSGQYIGLDKVRGNYVGLEKVRGNVASGCGYQLSLHPFSHSIAVVPLRQSFFPFVNSQKTARGLQYHNVNRRNELEYICLGMIRRHI